MRPPRESWQLTSDALSKILAMVGSMSGVQVNIAKMDAAYKAVSDLKEFVETSEECERP